MNRKLKVLGLAFLAVFAMSALTASAAQAQLKVTTTGPTWLTFSGSKAKGGDTLTNQTFTVGTLQVACAAVSGHATVTNGATEVTATDITYSECASNLPGPITITMNNCDYKFHGGKTDPSNAEHGIEGEVDLICPPGVAGPVIDLYTSAANHTAGTVLCKLTVTPFVNKKEITYTNTAGSPNDFDLKANVPGIGFTKEGSILCPNGANPATYTGEITVTGFKDLNSKVGEEPIKEGERTGVTIS